MRTTRQYLEGHCLKPVSMMSSQTIEAPIPTLPSTPCLPIVSPQTKKSRLLKDVKSSQLIRHVKRATIDHKSLKNAIKNTVINKVKLPSYSQKKIQGSSLMRTNKNINTKIQLNQKLSLVNNLPLSPPRVPKLLSKMAANNAHASLQQTRSVV